MSKFIRIGNDYFRKDFVASICENESANYANYGNYIIALKNQEDYYINLNEYELEELLEELDD